jgi:5'-3' exonuclease
MIALIDGDVVVYRCGFASQKQTEAQNCMNTEVVMRDILKAVQATSYRVYLSDSLENNFRYKIDPQYKANRKDMERPVHYGAIRQYLMNEYQATITPGQEADDALGIEQTRINAYLDDPEFGGDPTVICSIDKDLLQIPGYHYNLSSGSRTTVTPLEGIRHFYKQLLIGDRVDNIEGVRGIGPVKAGQMLDGVDREDQMFEKVRILYSDDERLLKNGQLLWVRRTEGEVWRFPNVEAE